jgi:sulfatase maturation enzyme AslB (radical SAM superfamily)
MNWFESPLFWEELHRYRHHMEKLHLAGGEPLLIKDCWNFLRRLVEDGTSKNITLSYNTNLSRISPEAKELWPRFKNVVLIVSMDAVGPANEFIRHPQSWTDFDRNLRTIEDEYEAYNIRTCQVQTTVQAYNVLRIEEICDYLAGYRKVLSYPLFNFLFEPEHLSPHVLPEAYRAEAIARIEAYVTKLQAGWNSLHPNKRDPLVAGLRGVAAFLRGPEKGHLFRQFQRHNDIFDRHRGQRILDYLPELAPLYGHPAGVP